MAPKASLPVFQHLLDTYESESKKVLSVWNCFSDSDLPAKPHERSSSVEAILKHQLLSERRFFAEFLGLPEPPPEAVLPEANTIAGYCERYREYTSARLPVLAVQTEAWWLTEVPFFDTRRERIWIFWRRVLHTCHHRTQLTVYLRLLDRPVPSIYGPTADVSWQGADPTTTVDAAGRK